MGAYSAIEVSTVFTDGRSQKEYYAEGIGLIKTVYPNKEGEQYEISLTGIVDSAALEVPIDLFIHDANLASYSKDERILTITTNCDLTAIINDELKVPASNGYVLLPNDISINRLEVNRAENAVIIDLNKALGAQSGDAQFLQNLADTLGQFFGATRAKITINGEFYDLDEYIDVTIEEDQVNTM
jgi:hypothetical protein